MESMKSVYTILLLLASNAFMTMAWYGHLKYTEWKGMQKMTLISIILLSWGIAFFEYCLMVPANRIGYKVNGGPFTLVQLKVIQEVITLLVFSVFTVILFKNESLKWNHGVAFILLVLSVYFVFRK